MRGQTNLGFVNKVGNPGLSSPHSVGSSGDIKGVTTKGVVKPSRSSSAGGFMVSRKAGSVRGSHSVA